MKHLYRLQDDGVAPRSQHPDDVENWYQDVENEAAPVRERLITGTLPSALSADERKSWARFVATLEHRGPRKVRGFREQGLALLPELVEQLWANSADPERTGRMLQELRLEAMVENMARAALLPHADSLADDWLAMTWGVVALKPGTLAFITSDYPLVELSIGEHHRLVWLPIGPRHLFVAAPWDDGGWDGEYRMVPAYVSAAANALQIQGRPNYLYSVEPLADDGVQNLRARASAYLEPPDVREV